MTARIFVGLVLGSVVTLGGLDRASGSEADKEKTFRAGAARVDVSPPKRPVIINGSFLEHQAEVVHDRLAACALALDDGTNRVVLVVVDSCMMPRELIDGAKELASKRTGLATDRMLVSATHTHSAPSAMGALGSRPDPDYVAFLPERIASAIERAIANLEPAEVGWSAVDDFEHTHCRRWVRRPDRILKDPFGQATVRANMHPGYESPDVVGPSGPVDPGLSVLAVRSVEGRPIAVWANYSMHYFGAPAVSADYYGRFRTAMARRIGVTESGDRPFVAAMTQGTSGDQQWMDYGHAKTGIGLDAYSEAVADRAHEAYQAIRYQRWVPLAMAEKRLTLSRRLPDADRLAWARPIVAAMAGPVPTSQVEVYAKEAIFLHEEPQRELKLQAIRIGELGIAAIPDEVYALTGLKIKARSPLGATFTIELANGSEGYIPPPEQHELGGYTTWPARTAGLEVQAEPRIVETVLTLFEEVTGRPRRRESDPQGSAARAVLASRPSAFWRLGEMDGRLARDASGHGANARFEGGVALYLDGPASAAFAGEGVINRAAHFAGGRLVADRPEPGRASTVELWFWNGLPADAREVCGVLLARGSSGDRLAIDGSRGAAGRLRFLSGGVELPGRTVIAPRSWHHVALVRDGEAVSVYLDGELEASGRAGSDGTTGPLLLGGHGDPNQSFEGKLDEIAVYDRALPAGEIAEHARASGLFRVR